MEQYWPMFMTGIAIEFACLLFVHPTMFTLVVCLKTTVCTSIWFVLGQELGTAPSPIKPTAKPTGTKPLEQVPAPNAPSQDAPAPGTQPSTTKPKKEQKEMSEESKKMMALAAEFKSAGYSSIAFKVMAEQVLGQENKSRIPESINKRKNATGKPKEDYEKGALALHEKKEKKRKEQNK